MSTRIIIAVVAMASASCALEEPATSTVEEHLCGGWLCGSNSPVMDTYGLLDLNISPNVPNSSGLVLQGFHKGNATYTPKVWQGKLRASRWVQLFNGLWTLQTLTGTDLVGGYLLIATTDGSGKSFAVWVTAVQTVASWAQPTSGTSVSLESYVLDYTWVSGWTGTGGVGAPPPHNICSNPPPPPHVGTTGVLDVETLGQNEFSTLLFEGDRIDPAAKRVTGIDNSWFNLGCAGHTVAKLALTGHTQAAYNANTFDTTLDERTTMLKMLTADYCGDGTPFTVTGQLLRWQDNHGTMHYNAAGMPVITTLNSTLESRWNQNGPVCLHKPRVDVNPTALALNTVFVDPIIPWVPIYQQVMQKCPAKMPPECADQTYAQDGFHLVSVTPKPVP